MLFKRNLFLQRFSKCFICFVLIVALSFNVIPRPVSASAIAGAFTYGLVSAPLVIDAIARGLGFLPSSTTADFNKLKTQIYDTLYSMGWVFDGMIKIGLATTAGGMTKTYISQDVVEVARSVIFSSNTISFTPSSATQISPYIWYTHKNGNRVFLNYTKASIPVHWIICGSDADGDGTYMYQIYAVSGNFFYYGNPDAIYGDSPNAVKYDGTDFYCYRVGTLLDALGTGVMKGTHPVGVPLYIGNIQDLTWADFTNGRFGVLDTTVGIEFADVGSPSISISEAYPEWYSESVSDPDDDRPLLPIGITGVNVGNTQSGAQSGESVEDVVDSIVSSPTIPDSGSTSGTISNTSAITSINSWVRSISDSIDFVIDWIVDIYNLLVDALDLSAIIEWLESLGLTLSEILEWIISLPASIAQSISDVIIAIFVPSDDYVTAKVESIKTRFSWVTPIVDYIDIIKNEMLGTSVPIIYIHLGDTEGSYNIGGSVPFLDMSWYSRYKSSGDAIISGFLWALFLWRLYIKLPNIIHGVGGDIGHFSVRDGKDYDI